MLTLTMVVACTCSFRGSRMFGMMWGHMPTPTTSPLWRIGRASMKCRCDRELIPQKQYWTKRKRKRKKVYTSMMYLVFWNCDSIYYCIGNTFLKHTHSCSLIFCMVLVDLVFPCFVVSIQKQVHQSICISKGWGYSWRGHRNSDIFFNLMKSSSQLMNKVCALERRMGKGSYVHAYFYQGIDYTYDRGTWCICIHMY